MSLEIDGIFMPGKTESYHKAGGVTFDKYGLPLFIIAIVAIPLARSVMALFWQTSGGGELVRAIVWALEIWI